MQQDLPYRKGIRLKDFDYSSNGAYFITVCTHNREHVFGEILNNESKLNPVGKIVEDTIIDLPNHNANISIDKLIIMPNHIHAIIIIDTVRRERFITVPDKANTIEKDHGIPEIVRQMKTFSSRRINMERQRNGLEPFPTGQVWQKSYYDRIIRDEHEYQNIWQYIDTNPLKWELDKYHE
jgi:putative transposase